MSPDQEAKIPHAVWFGEGWVGRMGEEPGFGVGEEKIFHKWHLFWVKITVSWGRRDLGKQKE